MNCKSCGKSNPKDAKYCVFCGELVKANYKKPHNVKEDREQEQRLERSYILPTFKGRISRGGFLYGLLGLGIVLGITISIAMVVFSNSYNDTYVAASTIISVIIFWYITVATTSMVIRRLHDLNQSAWLILIMLIPLANIVVLISLLTLKSARHNQYGQLRDNRSLMYIWGFDRYVL